MGSRRRARELALQALYHADHAGVTAAQASASLWATASEGDGMAKDAPLPEPDEVAFAEALVGGVESNRNELDLLIEGCSINWRMPRMPVVDRNILRLAAYELSKSQDVPATVAINEAVELAKKYGTAESKAFVNGIVDRLARNLGRVEGVRAKGKE